MVGCCWVGLGQTGEEMLLHNVTFCGSRVQRIKNPRVKLAEQTALQQSSLLLLGISSLPADTAAFALHLFRIFLHHFHIIPCPCG